ncbi:Ig-like domain repeat protein [Thermococcus sp. CX2]|uniref:Ig-like domain-containing protein n=1 Tax=Thermococcus sp. CX2 TaxID=163006 RepID=UPI0014396AA6|nr:Ig-like domain-containing protein [Thermococcus sp. CX2]NJE85995.1 Ig-like domain repeat protein [Thermococcus sp. CX2]
MRKLSVLIIALLLIGSIPLISSKAVEEPTQRDVFLYEYFSQVIVQFEYSLKYALVNESYGLALANTTLNELELIRLEALYYQEKGVDSKVMEVFPPFYEFSRNLVTINELLLEFHKTQNPAIIAGIKGTALNMESLLDEIDTLELMNGTEVLKFNTKKVRGYLNEIIEKVSSEKLPSGRFEIGISDSEPILYQRVTIFGSCPGNGTVTVVITGKNFTSFIIVNPQNGLFSANYRFKELGTYTIYATQGGMKSNTLNVTVGKIPSLFLVESVYSTFLNQTLVLSGRLVDYYGHPLEGREITVGDETLVTGPDGGFAKSYYSSKAVTFQVPLRFAGDGTHTGTSEIVTVEFRRFPVTITLNGPGEITLGQRVTFTGKTEPDIALPLTVYVNDTPQFSIGAENGTFSFTVEPQSPGQLRVYVAFAGSEVYDRATSNVVVLNVVPPENMLPRYIAIALLSLLLALAIVIVRRRERKTISPAPQRVAEAVPVKHEVIREEKIPEDVGEAYKLLREKLKDRFGISESLTPREVLRILRDWEFYTDLEAVTRLHEKAVYGEISLSEEELREFRERLEKLLRGGSGE